MEFSEMLLYFYAWNEASDGRVLLDILRDSKMFNQIRSPEDPRLTECSCPRIHATGRKSYVTPIRSTGAGGSSCRSEDPLGTTWWCLGIP